MSERWEDALGPLPRAIDAMPSVGEVVCEMVLWGVILWPLLAVVGWAVERVWGAKR